MPLKLRPTEWAVSRIYKTRAAVPAIVIPAGRADCPVGHRTDGLQGTLTETIGIALAVLRQLDDALSQCPSDGVVAIRSEAERGQRHLERNPHLTDRFTVKLSAVEVVSNGHGNSNSGSA